MPSVAVIVHAEGEGAHVMADSFHSSDRTRVAPSAMHGEVIDPRESGEWDADVLRHADSTIFHSRAWAEVLCRTYGHKPHYLRLTQNAQLRALLPLMGVESWATGRRGVCTPFSDFCAPLTFGDCNPDFVVRRHVEDLAGSHNWEHVEVRGKLAPTNTSALADRHESGEQAWAPPERSKRFFAHEIDLAVVGRRGDAAASSSARRAVAKAKRSGLAVTFCDTPQALSQFWELHVRTRRRHGLPPQPFAFFKNIHEHVIRRSWGFIGLAFRGRDTLAAAIFLHFGKNSLYKFGASDERLQELRANNLLMSEAIRYLAAQGFTALHLGRTDLHHSGLRRFKLSLGAAEDVVSYSHYAYRGRVGAGGAQPSGKAVGKLFRLLPPVANRLAGRLIYPHLH